MIRAIETTAEPDVGEPDSLYEVINGVRVEKQMSTYENVVASELYGRLHQHVRMNDLGRATIEVMFDLPDLPSDRRPDVAFVSYDRWPRDRGIPRTNAWAVVPDLAVEVVSPSDKMRDELEGIDDYFRSGVRMVWHIIPGVDLVYVYTSRTEVRILAAGDDLTGDPVVPGFRVPVADLFPPPEPAA